MNRRWDQAVCEECKRINFLPPHGINSSQIPCAYCGNESLVGLLNTARVEMPKFRSKLQSSSPSRT